MLITRILERTGDFNTPDNQNLLRIYQQPEQEDLDTNVAGSSAKNPGSPDVTGGPLLRALSQSKVDSFCKVTNKSSPNSIRRSWQNIQGKLAIIKVEIHKDS